MTKEPGKVGQEFRFENLHDASTAASALAACVDQQFEMILGLITSVKLLTAVVDLHHKMIRTEKERQNEAGTQRSNGTSVG